MSSSAQRGKKEVFVTSESEYASFKNFHCLRSPRVSEYEAEEQSYHNIMLFSSLSDAINCYIYLKVAHGFTHKCKTDESTGRRVIFSGHFKDPIESMPFVHGVTAGIHHVSLPFEDSSQFSKVYLGEFMEEIQIWSGITDLFHCSGSASAFMSQHVLFHESVSVSARWVDRSLLNIVAIMQVRLTERALSPSRHITLTWKACSS